ncbi:MAG: glycosyltransferase family 2 protein [Candidatus Thorarchaeota archaeon]
MSNNKKTVSCIIPTYNRQELISQAIESVISQTYKNLEIIVVNDASQDETEFVVKKYMKNDRRIKYVKNLTNLGGGGSRNVGIKVAKGDFVAFLDDDDKWLDAKIERQVRSIESLDAVMCACIKNGKKRLKKNVKKTVDLSDLRKGNNYTGGTSILMAKVPVMKDIMFDDNLPNYQDWDLLIRLAEKYKIGYLNEALVLYNDHNQKRITNAPRDMPVDQLEKRLGAIYKHKRFFGSYWFNYHIARSLLSYVWNRQNKFEHIIYVVKRCGILPVLRVFNDKIQRRLSN